MRHRGTALNPDNAARDFAVERNDSGEIGNSRDRNCAGVKHRCPGISNFARKSVTHWARAWLRWLPRVRCRARGAALGVKGSEQTAEQKQS